MNVNAVNASVQTDMKICCECDNYFAKRCSNLCAIELVINTDQPIGFVTELTDFFVPNMCVLLNRLLRNLMILFPLNKSGSLWFVF